MTYIYYINICIYIIYKVICRYIYSTCWWQVHWLFSASFFAFFRQSVLVIYHCSELTSLETDFRPPKIRQGWLLTLIKLFTSKNGGIKTKTQFFLGGWLLVGFRNSWIPSPKASPWAQDAPDVHAASPQRSRRRPQRREVCLCLGPGRRWEHRGDHVWCRGPGRPCTGDDAGKTGCLLDVWIGTDIWRYRYRLQQQWRNSPTEKVALILGIDIHYLDMIWRVS